MGQSLTRAQEVPDILWEYCGVISFMLEYPGMYSCDYRRSKLHDKICKHYNITKKESSKVTNHMDKFNHAEEVHCALMKLEKK